MNWETKHTGKGFNFFIFTVISALGLILLILHGSRHQPDRNIEDIAIGFLFSSPILLCWILVFSKFIFNKRVPVIVKADEINVEFHFNKRNPFITSRNDFSYSFHEYKRYCVLAINKRIKSKRGHMIDKEYFSIVGMQYSNGWKKETVKDIALYFGKLGVQFTKNRDKTFLLRIVE